MPVLVDTEILKGVDAGKGYCDIRDIRDIRKFVFHINIHIQYTKLSLVGVYKRSHFDGNNRPGNGKYFSDCYFVLRYHVASKFLNYRNFIMVSFMSK